MWRPCTATCAGEYRPRASCPDPCCFAPPPFPSSCLSRIHLDWKALGQPAELPTVCWEVQDGCLGGGSQQGVVGGMGSG